MIHIALASDNNYFDGMLVTAWSIVAHSRCAEDLVFHVLDGGVDEKNWAFFCNVLSKTGCQLDRIKIDQNGPLLKNCPDYRGMSKMTFARLLLPDLLPQVEKIVYSDVDVLWLADVAELWRSIRDDHMMAAVVETPIDSSMPNVNEEQWFRENGFVRDGARYFCAGVLSLNLGKMRREGFHRTAFELLKKNHWYSPVVDQTLLNALMSNRSDITFLEHKWQTGTGEMPARVDTSIVLHYGGDTPWKSLHLNHHMLTEPILYWHRVHAKIRGISTWKSLRQCNTAIDILAGRLLYLLASRCCGVRATLRFAMRMRGQSSGIPCLNAFMKKVECVDGE